MGNPISAIKTNIDSVKARDYPLYLAKQGIECLLDSTEYKISAIAKDHIKDALSARTKASALKSLKMALAITEAREQGVFAV